MCLSLILIWSELLVENSIFLNQCVTSTKSVFELGIVDIFKYQNIALHMSMLISCH